IGGAGTVALLGATKVIDLGKLAFWRVKVEPIPAGWVAVPVPARAIPAYTLVTKEFLMNPKTGGWEVVWTPPNLVPKEAILDLAKIRGRVMAHEKPPYYCFMEKDFLPVGTLPGIVAGVP